jgi:hypothetical protein
MNHNRRGIFGLWFELVVLLPKTTNASRATPHQRRAVDVGLQPLIYPQMHIDVQTPPTNILRTGLQADGAAR